MDAFVVLSWIYSNLNYVEFQQESGLKDNITIFLLYLIVCGESYLLLCSFHLLQLRTCYKETDISAKYLACTSWVFSKL